MSERSVWLRKRKQRSPYLFDGAVALVGAVATTVAFVLVPRTPEFPREADALGVALTLATWLPLLWRRRAPMAVFLWSTATSAVMWAYDYPDPGVGLASVFALYTVASHRGRAVTAAAVVVGLGGNVVSLSLAAGDRIDLGSLVASSVLVCGCAAWGDRKQVREAYFEQLELRAAEKERERIEAAERAVEAERGRIARELHDVVAHAMSVVAVQSGVGAHVIDTQPEAAKRILETISDTSRDALDEMRRLLGVLRQDGAAEEDLAPTPGLAHLEELAERVSAAGVPTTVTVLGERTGLAPGVDLAAYRIVQEALTNVVKHAGPARATVRVRYSPRTVYLQITDDGRGASAAPDARTGAGGHGIAGMRERAMLYGGRFSAGPRRGGGYRVVAVLRREASVSAA